MISKYFELDIASKNEIKKVVWHFWSGGSILYH